MLNVGFVTNNHYPRVGGLEYCTHYLAQHLNNLNDVKTSVACSTMPEIPLDFEYSYPCYRGKSFSILTPWLFKKNRERMVETENINLLHGQLLHGGGFDAMKLSEKMKIPFVAQSHGADVQFVPEINYGILKNTEQANRIKHVIKKANKLIAVSTINKENLIDLGAKPEDVEVIHNGVDITGINAIPFRDLRHQFNFRTDDFVIITVGRNKPVKRMELLFEALQLLKAYKSIKCLCVGPEQNLRQLAQKFDVEAQIVYSGRIPRTLDYTVKLPSSELINAYRSSNLYVSTSYVESFGNAAAEALACGIPVVVGQKHGVRDIINEDVTGWAMQKETAASLAELIINLYEKREELTLRKGFIKSSVDHLTWENIAIQTVALYKSIL